MNLTIPNSKLTKLGRSFIDDAKLISSLYINETDPIFEFSSYHVLSYLSFETEVYYLESDFGKSILLTRNNGEIELFTPLVEDLQKFLLWLEQSNIVKKILNVSQKWHDKYSNKINGKVISRSENEVIYDVNLLNELSGGSFSGMRQARNKLLNNDVLTFNQINNSNLSDALSVLEKWQNVQGMKYQKNKLDKEKFVYSKFNEFVKQTTDLYFCIGYVDKKPLSVAVLHRVEWKNNWGVIYLIKGINRVTDGGIHGVTDATYYHIFQMAKRWNLNYLNDGELGNEEGTREHKLRFKPVKFLKSYDILIKE